MAEKAKQESQSQHGVAGLALGALGVVFGDIGTSPLYTLKTVLSLAGDHPSPETVLGSISLIVWTLILITTVKYVNVAMRIDNNGEGGILALMSLLGAKHGTRPIIVAIGFFGAALIYGDGAITPAISVLSALEGLNIAFPSVKPYVLPGAVVILIAFFAVQPLGTAKIGKAFGPVMTLWFLVMTALGIYGIIGHPSVLWALDPLHGIRYLFQSGGSGFLLLGGVFLCVTGAEALYADMGHFGATPIRLAWSGLVFPSLVLSYAGQAALVLDGAPTNDNIFFRLCPEAMLVPLVLLGTVATIIASQSIVTGAFSMTRQAIQLGWLPRLQIKQTSAEGAGQIYVGVVNWTLMVVTLGLTIGFKTSDKLASSYGIAVAGTMLITSIMLFIAMREVWKWSLAAAGALAGLFLLVDATFFAANSVKILEGGYVPLLLAAVVYGVMFVWHLGSQAISARVQASAVPIEQILDIVKKENVPRVPGTAVFFTKTTENVPPILIWHLRRNRALHKHVVIMTVDVASVPYVGDDKRLSVAQLSDDIWRMTGHYGFMERPTIPSLLERSKDIGCTIDPADVTYYVGHETAVPNDGAHGLPRIVESLFSLMARNMVHVTDYVRLPSEQVVEIGRQVSI